MSPAAVLTSTRSATPRSAMFADSVRVRMPEPIGALIRTTKPVCHCRRAGSVSTISRLFSNSTSTSSAASPCGGESGPPQTDRNMSSRTPPWPEGTSSTVVVGVSVRSTVTEPAALRTSQVIGSGVR